MLAILWFERVNKMIAGKHKTEWLHPQLHETWWRNLFFSMLAASRITSYIYRAIMSLMNGYYYSLWASSIQTRRISQCKHFTYLMVSLYYGLSKQVNHFWKNCTSLMWLAFRSLPLLDTLQWVSSEFNDEDHYPASFAVTFIKRTLCVCQIVSYKALQLVGQSDLALTCHFRSFDSKKLCQTFSAQTKRVHGSLIKCC